MLEDIPVFRVRQIICIGSIEITTAAMIQIYRHGIDVVFLSLTGRFKFRLSNMNPTSVKCRQAQYRCSIDKQFRLKTACEMLRGKLINSKNWLIRRNRPSQKEVSEGIWKINTAIDMLEDASDTDSLLGVEGIAAREYFEAMKFVLKQDMGFSGRNRRPPKDPVNALLSFGYILLLNMILAAIEQAGLDPYLANLHAVQDRRPSLALDLMEEFRCISIDTVVVRIVNLIRVRPIDFFYDELRGTRMREQTIALFVSEIQARLKARIADPISQKQYQIKDMFLRQAYQYKALVCGERENYLPVIVK